MYEDLEIITVNESNLADEHICCAFSDKKCAESYEAKKSLMRERFKDGFTFKKLNVRAKTFIEYVPAEFAWAPVEAPGYIFIHCFWVSGKYKGHGLGKRLLAECLDDAESKGMKGAVIIVGDKKRPFLSDKKFMLKQGFEVCDKAPPHFELLVKRFDREAELPRFRECTAGGSCPESEGLTLYYSNQCPFTDYHSAELKRMAAERNIPITLRKLESLEAAQSAPSPFTIYSLFYNGKFLTQEILTEKRLDKLLEEVR